MYKNKKLSYLIIITFMFTIVAGFSVPQASAANLNDISGHWAQSQIENLVNQDIVKGYPDNSFKPENTITRAEIAVMVNKAFSFTNTTDIDFKDVKSTDWFAADIAKAKAAGYISGYPDGTMKPNQNISRQEAAVMIAKAAKLDTGNNANISFKDAASIGDWSRASVAAMVKAGYIKGYPDGTFLPLNSIKRAEAAVIINAAIKSGPVKPGKPDIEEPEVITNYDKAGTYGPTTGTETIESDVTISAEGVTLQNLIIEKNLIIAKEVGDGDVTLNNVTVKGKTYVRGGGKDSIYINGGQYSEIVIEKTPSGQVRIVAVNASGLKVTLAENAKGEEVILNGDIKTVTVKADDVQITTQGAANIGEVKIESGLKSVNISLAKDSTVNKMVLDSKANVTGGGTIKEASGSKASDSSFANKPDKITTPSSGGNGGGDTTYKPGKGSGVSAPTVSNISFGGVSQVIGAQNNITIAVAPEETYNKASVTLSKKARVTVKGKDINAGPTLVEAGTIENADAIKALTNKTEATGQELIDRSPIEITLVAVNANDEDIADKKTTYTVKFVVSAPTVSDIVFNGEEQVIGSDNVITIAVAPDVTYGDKKTSVTLSQNARVYVKAKTDTNPRIARIDKGEITIDKAIEAKLTEKKSATGEELYAKSPIEITLVAVNANDDNIEYATTSYKVIFVKQVKLGSIDDQTIIVGESIKVPVTVNSVYAKITVMSSAPKVAGVEVAVDGTELTIEGISEGTAVITVTGSGEGLIEGSITFTVTVKKAPPVPAYTAVRENSLLPGYIGVRVEFNEAGQDYDLYTAILLKTDYFAETELKFNKDAGYFLGDVLITNTAGWDDLSGTAKSNKIIVNVIKK